LAAPRYGTSTRSDCRKALLFDGGTMRRPQFSYPKKAFRRVLLSSFPFSWTGFIPSSYPLYSATINRLSDTPNATKAWSQGLTEGGGVKMAWPGRGVPELAPSSPHGSHSEPAPIGHAHSSLFTAYPGHPFSNPSNISSRDGWTSLSSSYQPRPPVYPVSTRPSHPGWRTEHGAATRNPHRYSPLGPDIRRPGISRS